MNRPELKRWTKISLRTLHLLALAGVGGGMLFGIDKNLWLNYWWLALASGAFLMLIDIVSNPVWIVQVRGLVIFLKLVLLAFLGYSQAWDIVILMLIIVMSGVISHAPSKVRYYSIYHKEIISSSKDTKG
jgi:hypothetical protein